MRTKGKAKTYRRWAKTRMIEKDLTITTLAQVIGVRRETISRAINGNRGSERLQARIKETLTK